MNHGILGDDALYERMALITEILGKFVSSAPRTVSMLQLAQDTGRSARELARLCDVLCREQLLQPVLAGKNGKRCWQLACAPSAVTLEDAYRCALASQTARNKPAKVEEESGARTTRDVDLLLMQASVSVNQSVLHLLRQFSLDRLKVSAAGMFPTRQTVPAPWSGAQLAFS